MEKSLGKASSKFGRDASQYLPPLLKAIVTTDSMERAPNYAGCVLEIFACSREKNYSTQSRLSNGEKSGQGFFKVWKRCEPGRAREN
ncbi:hypothetical protein BDR26DRAFT_942889 [Obelidium mucronatum]|nr:hypothetical protein BDR26DRAFT_942889 [Obelidium mucronatum]